MALALVVEPDPSERIFVAATAMAAGLRVVATGTFKTARSLLLSQPPAVLVTEIRLGPYNGLHLALLGRSIRPHMAQLVTSRVEDVVLQRDAEAAGATFVLKPMTFEQLLAALYRTVHRDPNADGTVAPTPPPLDRRYGQRRRTAGEPLDREARRRHRRLEPFLVPRDWRRSVS